MVALLSVWYLTVQLIPCTFRNQVHGYIGINHAESRYCLHRFFRSHSETPCLFACLLHHSVYSLAHFLPLILAFSVLHLCLYFAEILSIFTAQCWYGSTLIHSCNDYTAVQRYTFSARLSVICGNIFEIYIRCCLSKSKNDGPQRAKDTEGTAPLCPCTDRSEREAGADVVHVFF